MRQFSFLILLLAAQVAVAQPMNGNYTVGGATPDFATLEEAARAVKSAGVSGPVYFNIRPGTYTKHGGDSTLFVLDSIIAGVSTVNRITFQPDASTGGNVNNVILQADFNALSTRQLVIVSADYVTLRDLTFKDADSLDAPASYLVFSRSDNNNPGTDGLEIDNCTFLGTPYVTSGGQYGTDIGIGTSPNLNSGKFTHNRFYRIMRGITTTNDSFRGGTVEVDDNEFYQGFGGTTGSGNPLGTAIELSNAQALVRRNIVDMSGGYGGRSGIDVFYASTAVIERNIIRGRVAIGGPFDQFTGINVRNSLYGVDSTLVANNAVFGNRATVNSMCIDSRTANTRIVYNTLSNTSGGGGANIALSVIGANCQVLDNIILEFSSAAFVAMNHGFGGEAPGLVSDYNIIYLPGSQGESGLVRHGGVDFTTLQGYTAASGLDSHSVSKTVLLSDGYHLDECQAQDSDLDGIPIPGVTVDIDNAGRDPVTPFKGCDEAVRLPFDMFADGFRAGVGGAPFSVAAGDFFDQDSDDDIAVPDWDHRRILLFRNLRPTRSFVLADSLLPSTAPSLIKIVDFDGDGRPDILVGGDTAAVEVFWGAAGGGFEASVLAGTSGRVQSIEPEPSPRYGDRRVAWLTEDNGFLPTTGFLGSLGCFPGRQLCHDLVYVNPGGSYFHDTVPYPITALAAADVDTTAGFGAGYEIIALSTFPYLLEFRGLGNSVFSTPCEPGIEVEHREFQFGTSAYLGFGSSLIVHDFDGDGDRDIITTSVSENTCVFVRNLANVTLDLGDTIPTTQTRAVAKLDYDNDGDMDFVAANRTLYENGITVFLNDGFGQFTAKPNCFFPFANGFPNGMVASDFDGDGKTDLAIASSYDSLFVVYNLGGLNEPPPTGVAEGDEPVLPREASLSQNYPNPFNPSTNIRFNVGSAGFVSLKVYNVLGREVATLVKEQKPAGRYEVQWHPRGLGSGVYFYRLQVGGVIETRKLMLLK